MTQPSESTDLQRAGAVLSTVRKTIHRAGKPALDTLMPSGVTSSKTKPSRAALHLRIYLIAVGTELHRQKKCELSAREARKILGLLHGSNVAQAFLICQHAPRRICKTLGCR